jgi:hypothetical protein
MNGMTKMTAFSEIGRFGEQAFVAYLKVMSRHLPGKNEINHESSKDRTVSILDVILIGQLSSTCQHYR